MNNCLTDLRSIQHAYLYGTVLGISLKPSVSDEHNGDNIPNSFFATIQSFKRELVNVSPFEQRLEVTQVQIKHRHEDKYYYINPANIVAVTWP